MRGQPVVVALAGGGMAWMLHLLAGSFMVSIGCGRGWPALRPTLAGITAVCAAGAIAVTLASLRARQRTRRAGDDAEAQRLLFNVAAFLGLLFTIMIMLGGLTVVALAPCQG